MKLYIKILIIFSLAIICKYIFQEFYFSIKPQSVYCNFNFQNLQNGDLIFRRGRSVESHVVLASDHKSNFSHVGIIYIENHVPFVIHAVPGENKGGKDYIKKELVEDFLLPDKASEFAIYRTDFPQEINDQAAINAHLYYLHKLIFDDKYDLSTDDKLYCTELIIKAFQHARQNTWNINTTTLNILFGNIEIIMPGNFIENQHLHPIINF